MFAILSDERQAYLSYCTMKLLVGGHSTEWDMKERVYLVLKWLATYPQSPEGIFLRPHPILSLNLRAHLSQWHLLLSYQAVCWIYFTTCDRTWQMSLNSGRIASFILIWYVSEPTNTRQVEIIMASVLSSRSVGKGSLFYQNMHHSIQPAW